MRVRHVPSVRVAQSRRARATGPASASPVLRFPFRFFRFFFFFFFFFVCLFVLFCFVLFFRMVCLTLSSTTDNLVSPYVGRRTCDGSDGAMCACQRGYLGAACEFSCPGMNVKGLEPVRVARIVAMCSDFG
jgi:hypothetical protein